MFNQEIRDYIEVSSDCAVVFDNPAFDNSILGLDTNGRVIYSLSSMVNELSTEDNISEDDAFEFICVNTIPILNYIEPESRPIILEEL